MAYFNRYRFLNNDEVNITPPFIKLTEKNTDQFVQYNKNRSRLDKISQEMYGSPYYGWLILMANPELGGLEWSIPDGTAIRVPYPLDESIREYERKLNNRLNYYSGE